MESENGKIIIRKSKKGKWIFEVDIGAKNPMTIPTVYDLKDDSLNGKECKDSFDISKTKIPKDTREILKDFKSIDNFNLKLNKFARFEKKFIFFRNKVKDLEDIEIKANFGNFNFEENITKQEKYIKAIFKENIRSFSLKTDYRLIIGSEQSIYETSIRLHHIYGIPYIPASAIKGVVRSYIEQKEKLDTFIEMFGDENQEGKIVFFDAFPVTKPKIEVDIMNPHYGHYYNEGKAPTDTNNPIPINFLTVADTSFGFIIGSKEKIDEDFTSLFKKAMINHGIGAKTAVGYGYFQ